MINLKVDKRDAVGGLSAKKAIENRDFEKALAAYDSISIQYSENIRVANDMSVILAALGKLDEARAILENAIGRDPIAGSAFSNLREILARQAAISYSKAMKIESPERLLALKSDVLDLTQTKLVLLGQEVEKPISVAKLKPDLPKLGSEIPISIVRDSQKEIEEMITSWAEAWSTKDFALYISFYGKEFSNKKYNSLSKWSNFRKPRLQKRGKIVVRINRLKVNLVSESSANITFEQRYRSGNTRLFTVKRMRLLNKANGWKIVFEG